MRDRKVCGHNDVSSSDLTAISFGNNGFTVIDGVNTCVSDALATQLAELVDQFAQPVLGIDLELVGIDQCGLGPGRTGSCVRKVSKPTALVTSCSTVSGLVSSSVKTQWLTRSA